jgi:hypothetical protein
VRKSNGDFHVEVMCKGRLEAMVVGVGVALRRKSAVSTYERSGFKM